MGSPFQGDLHGTTGVAVGVEEPADVPEAPAGAVGPPVQGTFSLPPPLLSGQSREQVSSCLDPSVVPHVALLELNLNQNDWVHLKTTGRVQAALENWEKLTNDQEILQTVRGCKIPFLRNPPSGRMSFQPKFSREENELIQVEIEKLLEKGAIKQVAHSEDQFLGHLFLRPKKDGSQRPIFNLKPLNKHIAYQHFKMEGLPEIKNLLHKNDWMIKLDLKDAYFCVMMSETDRKWMRFPWKQALYEFQCLPFGLASAPRTFTKLMKPVVGFLRKIGMRLICYLDDFLVINSNPNKVAKDGKTLGLLLESLGFIINREKSVTIPCQRIEFLGVMVNSTTMVLSLPEEKLMKIEQECASLLTLETVSVRQLAALIGRLSAATVAVLPAPLFYRQLQLLQIRALMRNQSYEDKVQLSAPAKGELRWWLENLRHSNGKSVISPGPDRVIETDASNSGWGATMQNQKVQGHWTNSEKSEHINALELRAVWLALRTFLPDERNLHVHVRTDNMTTVAHINKLGGTRSSHLIDLTKHLWQFCLSRQLTLTAEHLPGIDNVEADALSRKRPDGSDWQLDQTVFALVNKRWTPCSIDLFASRTNRQLEKFVSWKADPDAVAVDAFLMNWDREMCYIFPPFCLISRCLAKIRAERAEAILIAPIWPAQPWFPLLLRLLVSQPVLLPATKNLLLSPTGENHPLLTGGQLKLGAWRVSGNAESHKAFLQMQPHYSRNHGGRVRERLTAVPGESGLAGVLEERLIRFLPLWSTS